MGFSALLRKATKGTMLLKRGRGATKDKILDALPSVLKMLSSWATDVLQKPVEFEAYGSAATSITDASSDIDLALRGNLSEDPGDVLARLYDCRENLRDFQVTKFVPGARAPLLTLARADGVVVDITVGNHLPVYNSRLVKEYCELDARLKPLACAVKMFAKAAGVVGAAKQHLSSYAWTLLAVFYLQSADLKSYLPSSAESSNLPCLQSGSTKQNISIQGRTYDVGSEQLLTSHVKRNLGTGRWTVHSHGVLLCLASSSFS